MDFIKRVLSTVVGIFVFLFVCFFLLLIMVGILVGSSSNEKIKIENNSVLNLDLDFPLLDNAGTLEFKDLPFFTQENNNGLFDLTKAIKEAAHDDRIKGIVIQSPVNKAGITQLKALRSALEEFKDSGKFVEAYMENYTQSDYYLSSVADSIYLNPIGGVDFKGLATELLYFKDLEEKTGVKFEVFRVGKYKSAVEPFIDNKMSDANREQITAYLTSLWKNISAEIASSRALSTAHLDSVADHLLARQAEGALKEGFVDKLAYRDEFEADLKKLTHTKDEDELHQIDIVKYIEGTKSSTKSKSKEGKIAVIYAQGQIYDKDGSISRIAPDQLVPAIKKAREDKEVKAIVLRVNSPGGSALASELIWRELEITKREKPVVVSMGDVAASGGYYISSGADRIFAEPTTITGSIGVFGLLPHFKALTDKIGVHAEQVKTHENAIFYSPFKEVSDNQRQFITEEIVKIYQTFKTRVSEGRELPMDSVETLAQGRVWTGEQALQNGLVDELGGLDEALHYAAEKANLKTYQIQTLPKFEIDPSKLLQRYGFGLNEKVFLKKTLGKELYPIYKDIKEAVEYKGSELLLPYKTIMD